MSRARSAPEQQSFGAELWASSRQPPPPPGADSPLDRPRHVQQQGLPGQQQQQQQQQPRRQKLGSRRRGSENWRRKRQLLPVDKSKMKLKPGETADSLDFSGSETDILSNSEDEVER